MYFHLSCVIIYCELGMPPKGGVKSGTVELLCWGFLRPSMHHLATKCNLYCGWVLQQLWHDQLCMVSHIMLTGHYCRACHTSQPIATDRMCIQRLLHNSSNTTDTSLLNVYDDGTVFSKNI